jgi:hypothetical protein
MEENKTKIVNYWLKTAVKVVFEQRRPAIR